LTNLKQLAFDITLIYDMPDYNKEVAYVSTKPVDYKPCINDIGDEISFDAKISALSSQHEDTFFRLKITVWDPNNLTGFPQLTSLSYPIKVISKPMNQRKPRKKTTPATRRKSAKNSQSSSPHSSPEYVPSTPLNTQIQPNCAAVPTELLEKLDIQQQETLKLLHELKAHTEMNDVERPMKRPKIEPSIELHQPIPPVPQLAVHEFESSFSTMLRSYSLMSSEEKAETVRKVLRTLSVRDSEQLEELVDIMGTAGLKTDPTPGYSVYSAFPINHHHDGHIGHEVSMSVPPSESVDPCPYRSELVRIDQFYNEVFF